MPFEFKKTEIEGLMLIKPHMYPDERGLYKKYYEKNIFAEHGITCEFTESSDLYSKKGAIGGFPCQKFQTEGPVELVRLSQTHGLKKVVYKSVKTRNLVRSDKKET